MTRYDGKAYDLVAAFIANIRYEAYGEASDHLLRLSREYQDGDDGELWREKHTDRVLTHNEVAKRVLNDAVTILMEEMDTIREVAP